MYNITTDIRSDTVIFIANVERPTELSFRFLIFITRYPMSIILSILIIVNKFVTVVTYKIDNKL